MSAIRLYLDDDEAIEAISTLIKSAQLDLYLAKLPGTMHKGDRLVSARGSIRLARKIAGILPEPMIPSRLPAMEHAVAIALTEGTRHEASK